MRLRYIIILITLVLISACTREAPKSELSDPGFGVLEDIIEAGVGLVHLPVLLKSDQVIKGIQFTLAWDTTIAKLGKPLLTDLNPGFNVSTSEAVDGQMKVLIFSLTGDELNTLVPEILTIPVSLINPQADQLILSFEEAVFAGPNAMSHKIPISHAKLKVKHS